MNLLTAEIIHHSTTDIVSHSNKISTTTLLQMQPPQSPSLQTPLLRRRLESNSEGDDTSSPPLLSHYQCQTPPPHLLPIPDPVTNTTTYMELPVQVHEMEVLFDYEIRHASGVVWADSVGGGGDWDRENGGDGNGSSGGIVEDLTGMIESIFGSKKDGQQEESVNDTTSSEGNESNGSGSDEKEGNQLHQLEMRMVTQLWDQILQDGNMTYMEDGSCAGLLISEDDLERQRVLLEGGVEFSRGLQGEAANDTDVDVTSMEDLTASLAETKILGLSINPPDTVDPDGCEKPSDQCTSIHGSLSALFVGTNEYAIAQYLTYLIRSGCENGLFLTPAIPALMIEFQNTVEAEYTSVGTVVSISQETGEEEEEEDYISKYGKLFVSMLAILGVGFVAALVIKRRKRRRRKKEEREMEREGFGDVTENGDGAVQGDLREEVEGWREQETQHVEDLEEEDEPMKLVAMSLDEEDEEEDGGKVVGEEKSVASGWSLFGNKGKSKNHAPDQEMTLENAPQAAAATAPFASHSVENDGASLGASAIIDQLELDVPEPDSNEVEISLSPRRP